MKYLQKTTDGKYEVSMIKKTYSDQELMDFRSRLQKHLEKLHKAMQDTEELLKEVEQACLEIKKTTE